MTSQRTRLYFLILLIGLIASIADAKSPSGDTRELALRYVNSLAQSDPKGWAPIDLGCLTMQRRLHAGSALTPDTTQRCWTDTLKAHTDMVTQKAEEGVFDAVGRDTGFGLLHDRHRPSENWKDYPPGVFVSPPVVRRENGPAPAVTLENIGPIRPFAVIGLSGDSPITLKGQAVDLTILYPDPLTAPLALRPEEVWWVTGAQRHFGPVREVQIRLIILSGLRKFGYRADRAVMNEALPDMPLIATSRYGLRPGLGRQVDNPQLDTVVKGELLPKTAKWWTRKEADSLFRAALAKAATLQDKDRNAILTRLLLIDPMDRDANTMRGDDAYRDFLKQGVAKGRLAARDEESLWELAELYWTLQAQTWRQEMTAVAQGHEPAADALYRSAAAYDALVQQGTATPEQRRRVGTLTRWNNDPSAALLVHEKLLAETEPGSPEHGRLLAEIAWDRLQWVSWERRYDHPWLQQAAAEATQAAAESQRPERALAGHYALVVAESLRVPHNGEAFLTAMSVAKQDLDKVPGHKGLQEQLVANDLVKAFTPEAVGIVLPTPARSSEVADVAIHAQPPKQDLFRMWDFDKDLSGKAPGGFTASTTGTNPVGQWVVADDRAAVSMPNVLEPVGSCAADPCFHFLTTSLTGYAYPDVTAQALFYGETASEGAGVVMGVEGSSTVYFVVLYPKEAKVRFYRNQDGQVSVLATETVRLATRPWHSLRAQRVNFLHINRPTLAAYIDGYMVSITPEDVIPPIDRYGVVVQGDTKVKFDSLHVLDLVTNRPMSKPAAY